MEIVQKDLSLVFQCTVAFGAKSEGTWLEGCSCQYNSVELLWTCQEARLLLMGRLKSPPCQALLESPNPTQRRGPIVCSSHSPAEDGHSRGLEVSELQLEPMFCDSRSVRGRI
jgi:hypothetical protein